VVKKISVGEIEKYLFYLGRNLQEYIPFEEIVRAIKSGRWWHSRLGYNNTELFQRFYPYRENRNIEWWLVRGVPDKIDWENAIVYELKTYRNGKSREFMLNVGRVQGNIYCWLTGCEKYIVVLVDVTKLKPEEEHEEFNYDESIALYHIYKGIKLKKWLKGIREQYQEMVKE